MLPTLRRTPRIARRSFPTLRFDVDRMFEDFFGRPVYDWTGAGPLADLYETDDEYVVELDLPGWDRKDIDVTVEQGVLSIRGEKTQETEEELNAYHVRERGMASFQRSFTLPHTIDPNAVNAKFENGVLRVQLPKMAEAKARRIEVSVK